VRLKNRHEHIPFLPRAQPERAAISNYQFPTENEDHKTLNDVWIDTISLYPIKPYGEKTSCAIPLCRP
jgi:hypothetical protein